MSSFVQSSHGQVFTTSLLSLINQWQSEKRDTQDSKLLMLLSCIYLFTYIFLLVLQALTSVQLSLKMQSKQAAKRAEASSSLRTVKSLVGNKKHTQTNKLSNKEKKEVKAKQMMDTLNKSALKVRNEYIYFIMMYAGTIELIEQDLLLNPDVKFWCKLNEKNGSIVPYGFAHLPALESNKASEQVLADEEPRCSAAFYNHQQQDYYLSRTFDGFFKGYIWSCISAKNEQGEYVNPEFMELFHQQVRECDTWYKDTYLKDSSLQSNLIASCNNSKRKITDHRTLLSKQYFIKSSTYQEFSHEQMVEYFINGESDYIRKFKAQKNISKVVVPVEEEQLLLGSLLSAESQVTTEEFKQIQLKGKQQLQEDNDDETEIDDEQELEQHEQESVVASVKKVKQEVKKEKVQEQQGEQQGEQEDEIEMKQEEEVEMKEELEQQEDEVEMQTQTVNEEEEPMMASYDDLDD